MRLESIFIVCVSVFVFAADVRADVVMMPPPCPTSSMNAFCHGPATCRPRACTSASDCTTGETCAPRALCTETHACGGRGTPTMVTHVIGACDATGACPTGTCSTLSVCVAGSAIDGARVADAGTGREHAVYCGCRAGTRGGSAVAIASLLAVLAAAVARHRGRGPSIR